MKEFLKGGVAGLVLIALVLLVMPIMFRLFAAWFTFVMEF